MLTPVPDVPVHFSHNRVSRDATFLGSEFQYFSGTDRSAIAPKFRYFDTPLCVNRAFKLNS